MKAIIHTEYGPPDVLRLEEVAKPTPQDHEVLIKVQATGLNAADWHLMRADPFLVRLAMGLTAPKNPILGADVAGIVEAIGASVSQFKVGDEVFGDLSSNGFGGFAEYVAAPESSLVLKPKNLSFAETAALPMSAVTALQAIRNNGKLQAGQKVLIVGASGGVGSYAVQIAKALGAEVTAICSTASAKAASSLGADHVIDYTKEDFTQNGQLYDLIVGVNGYNPISAYKRALAPNGIYVMIGGGNKQMLEAIFSAPLTAMGSNKKFEMFLAQPNSQDLEFIVELIEAGKVKPVIDRTYPLAQTADAIRYLEEGHAKGKVVVTI
jgi:NADPH:quinone reductase-like Zn-dependent oxidoreductase